MTDEKKEQLLPYFAFLYSQQLNPEKYGNLESIEEWSQLIQDDEETLGAINDAVSQLTDEDWDMLEAQYNDTDTESKQNANQSVSMYAKNGAKLEKLKNLRSYKKGGGVKKCSCGCDMVSVKEKGGKIVTKCACGCSTKKAYKKIRWIIDKDELDYKYSKFEQKWNRRDSQNKVRKLKD